MNQLEQLWRDEWGRLLALLVRQFRDVDLAEDALADAFEAAAGTWSAGPDAADGQAVPDNPAAWLLTVARRKALDRLRGADTARRKLPLLAVERSRADSRDWVEEVVEVMDTDDELRLLFLTCHPALAAEAQVALALRLVLGLETAEIARLFLVPEPTMAARITRAKKKIAVAGLPFALPEPQELESRIETAVRAIYLGFTAGYAPGQGDAVVRTDLAGEATRLGQVLARLLGRQRPPMVDALLALMLLQHSRRDARVGPDGGLVLLADQDRTRWHADEIEEGLARLAQVRQAAGYTEELRLQAAIAGLHAVAVHAELTDWPRIARLYARLEQLTGSPVVRLNRAVAVAEADGPRAGLALLAGLDEALPRSHRLPAVRAELAARSGDDQLAREQYLLAIERCGHEGERTYLRTRLAALS
ncbi:MAG: sigma factor-like helix-turn-helix DNA-binding protein [Microlunatus sp.]